MAEMSGSFFDAPKCVLLQHLFIADLQRTRHQLCSVRTQTGQALGSLQVVMLDPLGAAQGASHDCNSGRARAFQNFCLSLIF